MAGVSKMLVPKRGICGRKEGRGQEPQRVEGSRAVTPDDLSPSR